MPARIRNPQRLSVSLSSNISPCQSSPSFLSCTCLSSSSSSSTVSSATSSTRSFSSTPSRHLTKQRKAMFDWLNGPGSAFKEPLPGSTNYLSAYDRQGMLRRGKDDKSESKSGEGKDDGAQDQELPKESVQDLKPFPLNPHFISENVLSEELRNEIHNRVAVKGESVNAVSVKFGVDLRRVGAAVRLVELEKRMVKENKPLARPYAQAVQQMLPTTPLAKKGERQVRHEAINELPVHHLTRAQIFYPVSESRQFNRVDAGRVFSGAPALLAKDRNKPINSPEAINKITHHRGNLETVGKGDSEQQVLLPADVRIPHPHLVASEYDKLHRDVAEEQAEAEGRSPSPFQKHVQAADEAQRKRKERQKRRYEESTTRVKPEGSRYEFRFRDAVVSQQTTGQTGRGTQAPGRRYGVPTSDRKRGHVKIPTKVVV